MEHNPILTTKELALKLKVTPATVSAWLDAGCPHVLIGRSATGQGRRPRFELERVMAWLEARTEAAKQENPNRKEDNR